jgi:hypothetical protein
MVKETDKKDDLSFLRSFIGFIVALLVIPFLFVITCFPLGAANPSIIPGYSLFFAILCILAAIKIKNIGFRIGVAIAIGLIIIYLTPGIS